MAILHFKIIYWDNLLFNPQCQNVTDSQHPLYDDALSSLPGAFLLLASPYPTVVSYLLHAVYDAMSSSSLYYTRFRLRLCVTNLEAMKNADDDQLWYVGPN